jgi:cystathionine beta-lyase/cystathionine gamma-synthase
LRLARQSESAAWIAQQLAARPDVARVHYPTLSAPGLAARQHRGAHGAVLSFELDGGYERACSVLRHVELCRSSSTSVPSRPCSPTPPR